MTDTASGGPSSGTEKADEYLKHVSSPPEPASFEGLKHRKRLNEVNLHNRIGNGALLLMVGQLLIADTAFYIYGFKNSWDIPTAAITTWLGATVIQIVGVVLVIAKNLFPAESDS